MNAGDAPSSSLGVEKSRHQALDPAMSHPPPATRPCDALMRARWLITQNATRDVLEDAGLAIQDGLVVDIGPWAELTARREGPLLLEDRELLVLPGLVNAHTHAPMTLFRGLADDMELMPWLERYVFPVEQRHTTETVRYGALLACAEMTRAGVTAFADMHFLAEYVAQAADHAGLRALVGEAVFGFPNPSYADFGGAEAKTLALLDKWKDHPRVAAMVAPHAVYTTTPEMLQRCWAIAEAHDVPWTLHCAENDAEVDQCATTFGKHPLEYLEAIGCLGPRALLAHCVALPPPEMDRLARAGATVLHCPRSNMKLASGVAPVPELRRRGVRIALGTDGAASNNTLSMLDEMTMAAMAHKGAAQDATLTPAQAVLDMATCEGARALGLQTGRLAPGLPADLVALDLSRPSLTPCYDPISHVVYAASPAEVALTMVAGETLYQDGRFTRLDYPALLEEFRSLGEWVRGLAEAAQEGPA